VRLRLARLARSSCFRPCRSRSARRLRANAARVSRRGTGLLWGSARLRLRAGGISPLPCVLFVGTGGCGFRILSDPLKGVCRARNRKRCGRGSWHARPGLPLRLSIAWVGDALCRRQVPLSRMSQRSIPAHIGRRATCKGGSEKYRCRGPGAGPCVPVSGRLLPQTGHSFTHPTGLVAPAQPVGRRPEIPGSKHSMLMQIGKPERGKVTPTSLCRALTREFV